MSTVFLCVDVNQVTRPGLPFYTVFVGDTASDFDRVATNIFERNQKFCTKIIVSRCRAFFQYQLLWLDRLNEAKGNKYEAKTAGMELLAIKQFFHINFDLHI